MRTLRPVKKRRGYLLTWVLAMIAVMLALIAALHHYEVVSRRVSGQAMAELQFLQARRWELARLNKLVPDSWAPSLDVSGSTRCVANGTLVANDTGKKIFQQGSWYTYNGFPDLEIKRDAPATNPPPYHQRYVSRANSWASTLPKKDVQTVVTDLSSLAAYAPAGSIHLESVGSWSNPPLDAKQPYDKPTGEEPWVVAWSDISVGRMAYGRVHMMGTGTLKVGKPSDPSQVYTSAGVFPQAGFETALFDSIKNDSANHVMHDLREVSEAMDDKTGLVGDECPQFWELPSKALKLFSVRSSFEFKCPSIPEFEPSILSVKRLRFHAPFGPDIGTAVTKDRLDFLNKALKEARGRAKELFDRKMGYEVRLNRLKGGLSIPADTLVIRTEIPASPGLIKSYATLRRALLNDDARMAGQDSLGATAYLTDLETNQALLCWLAEVGPQGWPNPDKIKPSIPFNIDPRAEIPGFVRSQTNSYPRAQIGPLLLNGIYKRLDMTDKGVLTYNGTPLTQNGAISPSMWEEILLNSDPPVDPARVQGTPLTPLQQQRELFQFLLRTEDSENPWTKTAKIVKQLELDSLGMETAMKLAEEALDKIKDEINKEVKKTRPETIEADNLLANVDMVGFGQLRGLDGRAFLPYGMDIFLLVDLIRAIIAKKLPENYIPRNPMVYSGTKSNAAQLDFSKGTVISANFTVPAGRTFYYADSMTIKGDLCLDRGACLAIVGNLTLVNPDPSPVFAIPWFGNSGRIVMEPGSSLVVKGNLSAEGSRYTSSVVLLTEGGRVDPLSCAILATGDINLPYGMSNGMNIPQLFGTLGDNKNLPVFFYSYLFTEALPLISKWPLPNPVTKSWPGFGPFSPRRPYFCRYCPEWEFRPLTIWIPFTIITFTIYLPWDVESMVPNQWNKIASWIAPAYAAFDNLMLGENLSKHTPLYFNGTTAMIPIVPKISPAQLLPDGWRLPPPPRAEGLDQTLLAQQMLNTWVQQSEQALSSLETVQNGEIQPGRKLLDAPPAVASIPVPSDWREWEMFMLKIYNKVMNWTHFVTPGVLADGIGCESSGCLVYGNSIRVGLDSRSSPVVGGALLASGLFLAENDINIHALHTLGCLISRGGSINNLPGVSTELLANPQFTRAYLNSPTNALAGLREALSKGADSKTLENLGKISDKVLRTFDPRYGPRLPDPKAQYVGVPGPLRITQDGYSQ